MRAGPCTASQCALGELDRVSGAVHGAYPERVGHLSLPIHGLEEQQEALYPRGGECEDSRVVVQRDGQHRVCGLLEGRTFNKEEGDPEREKVRDVTMATSAALFPPPVFFWHAFASRGPSCGTERNQIKPDQTTHLIWHQRGKRKSGSGFPFPRSS